MCPVSMTYSAIPALRVDPELAAEWEPRLTLPDYERGALCGMAMTEKQGGSDVRAGTTRAEPAGDGRFELTGHKWFCSHPMGAVFLVLAQAPGGLSCFVVERGPGFELQRLKDKLGTRSLASREVEFRGAPGAAAGRGGPRRGDDHRDGHAHAAGLRRSAARRRCAAASPRRSHHARHRSAFGARLAEQPLMVNVLADLAIESEAATASALRLARAYDEDDRRAAPLRHRGHEVLDLQARDAARRRGARVPRRQRLRRGVADAAAAARRAAQRHLGGLGQRDLARRAARARARARRACPPSWPSASSAAAPTRGSTRTSTRCPARWPSSAARTRSGSRGAPSRTSRSPSRARCSSATRRPRSPTRSAPAGWARRAGRAFGTLPRGVDGAAIAARALADVNVRSQRPEAERGARRVLAWLNPLSLNTWRC